MLVPDGVTVGNTIRFAKSWGKLPGAAVDTFRPGGQMDYQRTMSTLRDENGKVLIDQRFIAFGNYNFGVYAAASGMNLELAQRGAAALYGVTSGLNKSGPYGGNPINSGQIHQGYDDYMSGNTGR